MAKTSNKNSLKSFIIIHLIYHFMIKCKKTTENCLINVLLGHLFHHYHFCYLIRAHHLKHICPEILHTVFQPHMREIDFEVVFAGEAKIQPRTPLVQSEAGSPCGPPYMVIGCNPSLGSLV